jgi:hypothetical protein
MVRGVGAWLLRSAAVVLFVTALAVALLIPNQVLGTPQSGLGNLYDPCDARPNSLSCFLERQQRLRVDRRLPLRVAIIGGGAVGALILLALSFRVPAASSEPAAEGRGNAGKSG